MTVRLTLVVDVELEGDSESVNASTPWVALHAAAHTLQNYGNIAQVYPVRVEVDGDVELYSHLGDPV